MSYGERSSVRGAAAPCWGPCRMENRRRPFAVAVRGGNVSGSVTLGLSAGCPPPLTPLLPSPHRPVVGGGFFRVWGRGGRVPPSRKYPAPGVADTALVALLAPVA